MNIIKRFILYIIIKTSPRKYAIINGKLCVNEGNKWEVLEEHIKKEHKS